jgi:hypothetical protein
MMDVPLTVTSIMRYGTTNFRDKEVVVSGFPRSSWRMP